MSINVIPVLNPHQKMEGIQNVRPQEILKILEKAKNLPIKQEGDFVKLQNYQFQVDEFEEMEDPLKNNKKNKKQSKNDLKKESQKESQDSKDKQQLDQNNDIDLKKQPKPKAKQIKQQPKIQQEQKEEILDDQENQDIQDNNNEEEQLQEQQQNDEEENQQKESEVDLNDMQKQLNEYEEENNNQLSKSQQQSEAQENSQIQQSQISQKSSNQKKKKFQSGYAAMMDDLLNESEVSINDEQQQSKKEKSQEKQMISSQIDAKKEQEYLKIIKQYQQKIKQLNEAIEQQKQPVLSEIIEDQIEDIQEQLDKTEESISNKKHLYPGMAGIGISLYDEFRLPQIVEDQVQHRLKELGVQDRNNQQDEYNEQRIKDLEEQHQAEINKIKQNYEEQMQQMKLEIELQQQKILEAEKIGYAESEISRVIDKDEIEKLRKDPLFSVMSSNLQQSVDSNVSELMKDESIYLKYRDVLKKYQPQENHLDNCMEIINSKFHDLITLKEAQEFNQLNTDSNISLSKVMGIGDAINLIEQNQNINSDIDSIISPSEQIRFKKDPKFQEPSLPDSSIEFSIPENYKLQKMIDSDYSNLNMNINEDGSLFLELQKELEQNYPINESNKFIVYQQIIQDQKQVFDKQVKKLSKLKPTYKSKQYFGESIDSSIGSLANQQIPNDVSSNVSMISKSQSKGSIIGSVISENEKAQLQQQCLSDLSSVQLSKNAIQQLDQVSSGISQLNSIVDSYRIQEQTPSVSSGISKILNDQQLQKEKYSVDSSLNISQGGSSVKSFLLLKKSVISKKY